MVDVYQEHEIIELFQREMIQTQNDAKMAIDILFEEIDFTKFTTDTIEFYQDIFGNFLCEFFDSYVDSKRRNICKKKILYIEKKVNDIDEEYVRIQLYKSLNGFIVQFVGIRPDFDCAKIQSLRTFHYFVQNAKRKV